MFPIQDLNPTRRLPILTYALIGLNILVFAWQQSLSPQQLQEVFIDLSVVPAFISQQPFSFESLLDIFRSMFFHGGVAHIGGNMLYLYLFGDNVEDRFGWLLYLALYVVCGVVAALSQVLIDPSSEIPMVGASGAIAGVLGSYMVLFPGVKVRGIIPIGRVSGIAKWPAWAVLGLWFGMQLFNGVSSLGTTSGGVAFFAHIGGFVAGVIITLGLMQAMPHPPIEERREMLYERTRRYPL